MCLYFYYTYYSNVENITVQVLSLVQYFLQNFDQSQK